MMGGTGQHVESSDGVIMEASVRDPDRFAEIYDRHRVAVHTYAVRAVGQSEALDLATDVFVQAFRSRGRFDARYQSALPWLMGIASHLAANRHRSRAREKRAYMRIVRDGGVAEFEAEAADRLTAEAVRPLLRDMLRGLRPQERQVIELFVLADLSYEEIGEALNIPEGTVKSRLSRGREKLRRLGDPRGELMDGDHG